MNPARTQKTTTTPKTAEHVSAAQPLINNRQSSEF